jgi:hypothetical protein
MHTINKPLDKTYFIYTKTGDSRINYGSVETTQISESSDVKIEEKFTIYQDWINRLDELGVDTSEL